MKQDGFFEELDDMEVNSAAFQYVFVNGKRVYENQQGEYLPI